MKKRCLRCKEFINLDKDLHVLLGTYKGKKAKDESYFHWTCFKMYWEERIRVQAKNMVDQMAGKMMPLAKELIGRVNING